MYCAELDTGKEVWSHQTAPDTEGTHALYCAPLVTPEAVYFAALDGQIYALDAKSGAFRWAIRAAGASEIDCTNLATDRRRLFVVTRPTNSTPGNRQGESGLFAIGE